MLVSRHVSRAPDFQLQVLVDYSSLPWSRWDAYHVAASTVLQHSQHTLAMVLAYIGHYAPLVKKAHPVDTGQLSR